MNDAQASAINDFVETHGAYALRGIAYPLRYLMIARLLDGHNTAAPHTQKQYVHSIFRLLFTNPYPAGYEAFEDKWAKKTVEYLRGENVHRFIKPPEYLPLSQRTIEAQMRAYRELSGDNAPCAERIDIDLHQDHPASYLTSTRVIVLNPFVLGHLAVNVVGGALHEQAHDVSLTNARHYMNAIQTGAALPQTPFSDMAVMLALEMNLYDRIAKTCGRLGKFATMIERVASNFESKVEYALIGSTVHDSLFFDSIRARRYTQNAPQDVTRLEYDLRTERPSLRLRFKAGRTLALKRGGEAVSAAAHRVRQRIGMP